MYAAMANELQDKISQASTNFVNEIINILAEAFTSTASGLSSAPPGRAPVKQAAAKSAKAVKAPPAVKGKPGRPAKAAQTQAAPPAKSGKRVRRTEADLAETGDKLIKLLQKNKAGMRIEAINKELGTSTKELMRPMAKMLEDGRIRKEGERRATVYFAK